MMRSPNGSPVVLPRQIVVGLADGQVAVEWRGELGEAGRNLDQRPRRRPLHGRLVRRIEQGRLAARFEGTPIVHRVSIRHSAEATP